MAYGKGQYFWNPMSIPAAKLMVRPLLDSDGSHRVLTAVETACGA
jgi:hypothetical protein